MTHKQHTGKLAPLKTWLDSVTGKDIPKGAAFVILTGLFAGGAAYSAASKMGVPIEGVGGTLQIVTALSVLVMTLLGWVFSTLICHTCARLLGGIGDRNRMFALSGYALIPTLIQQFLRFVSYWFLGQTTLSADTLVEVFLNHFNVFSITGIVLLGTAVMLNYGISGKKSALIALVPTIIAFSFAVYSLTLLTRAARTGGLFGLRGS